MNPYIESVGEIVKNNRICKVARLIMLQLSQDGKAINICRYGAWSMGRSKNSYVHIPHRVYSNMFEELVKLNNADSELLEKFIEFSLEYDADFYSKLNKKEQSKIDEKIELFPGMGNKVNYKKLKKLVKSISIEVSFKFQTNIRPSSATFYKGLTAHTLMKEGITSIDYKIFIGRKYFLENFMRIWNII